MTVESQGMTRDRRGGVRMMFVGAAVALMSLWLGTVPLTIYAPGDADETVCGDAWNAFQAALPEPCYSTFYWSGWLARLGLVLGLALIGVGAYLRLRRMRAETA